jgi:hypothetical protein
MQPPPLIHTFRHTPELGVGRTAAACVHPLAAWRVLPTPWRILVVTIYTAASYVTVLSALIVMEP